MRALVVLLILLPNLATSQEYLGETPPESTPVLFAPRVISKTDRHEFGSTFSRDGKTCYIGVDHGEGDVQILVSNYSNGKWSEAEPLFPNFPHTNNDPMLNPDESELYFISNAPLPGTGEVKNINIWYVKNTDSGWSEPIPLDGDGPVNTPGNEYYISFDAAGNMFYGSNYASLETATYNYDIYMASPDKRSIERLPDAINTGRYEADVYVAPDQSYMIFCSIRRNGMGNGDLYISFNENGTWTEAVNMGAPVNSEGHELCPYVTHDGKYFFYTSGGDIYWVSTKIFEQYKHD